MFLLKSPITIIDAIWDPNILGDTMTPAQEAALKAVYGFGGVLTAGLKFDLADDLPRISVLGHGTLP